jgi:hypothetical protein
LLVAMPKVIWSGLVDTVVVADGLPGRTLFALSEPFTPMPNEELP